jgi:hypothetical protein
MPVAIVCAICSTQFWVRPSRVKKGAKYCSYACHQIGEGRKGGAVRGEQVKRASKGKTYTKTKGRHTHRVVAEERLGRSLLPKETVHHADENKLNNDPGNIEVLPDQATHMQKHRKALLAARKAKHGY